MRRLLYDEKESRKRDMTSPACGGVFDTVTPQREELYDAVTSVNMCVFSSPCLMYEAYQEFTFYTYAISNRKKEMLPYLSPRE